MSHLPAALRHKRTPSRPQPWDGITKKVLWGRLQEAQDRIERAAAKAEDLRRLLWNAPASRAMRYGEELAAEIRAILRDGAPAQNQEDES